MWTTNINFYINLDASINNGISGLYITTGVLSVITMWCVIPEYNTLWYIIRIVTGVEVLLEIAPEVWEILPDTAGGD